MFACPAFKRKCSFWAHFFQKLKTFFGFYTETNGTGHLSCIGVKTPFLGKLGPK